MKGALLKGLALLLLTFVCVISYVRNNTPDQDPYLVTDYSRLHPVKVERVVQGHEEEQLIHLLQEAREQGLTVSISGQRHSQGGHTYYEDGIVVDMTSYNRILSLNEEARQITVQAGATWEDVQDAINAAGLSVKSMQSQNIFTVGGSVSINAHGRDIRQGSLISSVDSYRLLTADGQIRNVSRTDNRELFPLALGGYGLFGIILDITLNLTEDEVYTIRNEETSVSEYTAYFKQQVLDNPDIRMHIARVSVAPDSFLNEMYAVNYELDSTASLERVNKLRSREQGIIPSKILFNINRSLDWGRNSFWELQKAYFERQQGGVISRNNAMRAGSEFMEYRQAGSGDLLQEYFVPLDAFEEFVARLGTVIREEELDLLNITVRYVNQDQEAVLSYAKEDMFALVCLFHSSLSEQGQEKMKAGVQRIIDEVIAVEGTYYLPYVAYPTLEQFEAVYPRSSYFFEQKNLYDPEQLFMNYFYETYRGDPS